MEELISCDGTPNKTKEMEDDIVFILTLNMTDYYLVYKIKGGSRIGGGKSREWSISGEVG